MTKRTEMKAAFKANDLVRVGAVGDAIGWWFARVQNITTETVAAEVHCSEGSLVRTYPISEVQGVDKGSDRTWMLGLEVPIPSKQRKGADQSGIVTAIRDPLIIEYQSKPKQKRSYQEVIDSLYAAGGSVPYDEMPWNVVEPYTGAKIPMKAEIYKLFEEEGYFGYVDAGPTYHVFVDEGKFLGRGYFFHVHYPADNDEEWMAAEEVEKHMALAEQQRRNEVAKPGARGRKRKTQRKPASKRQKPVNESDEDSEYDSDSTSSAAQNASPVRGQGCVRRQPTRRAAVVKRQKAVRDSEDDSGAEQTSDDETDQDDGPIAVAVAEVESKAAAPLRHEDPLFGYDQLNASLCSCYDHCLHSKNCTAGLSGFACMLAFHRKYPDKNSREMIIDLLVSGPRGHMKNIRFPDLYRTQAGSKMVQSLLKLNGMHDEFAKDLGKRWKECLEQMTKPIFMAVGDEQRTNHDAFLRIRDSLLVKAHSLEFFGWLLDYEQSHCAPNRDAISKKQLFGNIVSDETAGCKWALEEAVQAYVLHLVRFGPFLTGTMQHLCKLPDGPTNTCLEQLISAAEKLNRAFGKVVSLLAWLYSIVECERVLNVSDLIGNTVLKELAKSSFDPKPFFGDTAPSKKQCSDDIKIQFIVGLHRDIVPQLRPHLANKLSVAAAYNCIFE